MVNNLLPRSCANLAPSSAHLFPCSRQQLIRTTTPPPPPPAPPPPPNTHPGPRYPQLMHSASPSPPSQLTSHSQGGVTLAIINNRWTLVAEPYGKKEFSVCACANAAPWIAPSACNSDCGPCRARACGTVVLRESYAHCLGLECRGCCCCWAVTVMLAELIPRLRAHAHSTRPKSSAKKNQNKRSSNAQSEVSEPGRRGIGDLGSVASVIPLFFVVCCGMIRDRANFTETAGFGAPNVEQMWVLVSDKHCEGQHRCAASGPVERRQARLLHVGLVTCAPSCLDLQ